MVPAESDPEPPRICQVTVQLLVGMGQEWLAMVNTESDVTRAVGPPPSPQKPGKPSVLRPATLTSSSELTDWVCPPVETISVPSQRPSNSALASWSSVSDGSVVPFESPPHPPSRNETAATAMAPHAFRMVVSPRKEILYSFWLAQRKGAIRAPLGPLDPTTGHTGREAHSEAPWPCSCYDASMLHELKIAARSLLRARSFSLAVVLTLALAIGATTAVFSVLRGVLLAPLPFPNPDALVHFGNSYKGSPPGWSISPVEYRTNYATLRSFSSVGAWAPAGANLTTATEPIHVNLGFATASLLPTLG